MLPGSGPTKARDLIVWCFLVPPEMEAYCLCLLTLFACDVIVVSHSKLIILEVCGVLGSTGQCSSISKPSSIISPTPRHLKPALCIVWRVWWYPLDSGLWLCSPWFSLYYWNVIVSTDIFSKSLMSFIFCLLQLFSGCTDEVFISEYFFHERVRDRVSLHSPAWPRTCIPPASASHCWDWNQAHFRLFYIEIDRGHFYVFIDISICPDIGFFFVRLLFLLNFFVCLFFFFVTWIYLHFKQRDLTVLPRLAQVPGFKRSSAPTSLAAGSTSMYHQTGSKKLL